MADDELATFRADPSAAAALDHAAGPDLAFRIALDATHDRKAVIRIGAWTAAMLGGRIHRWTEVLQYQWPFLPALEVVELWAGNDEKLTDLTHTIRLLGCAAIPAAVASQLVLRAASLPYDYGPGFVVFIGLEIALALLLKLGVPWFYKRKVAKLTEPSAVAIVHDRLVKGAAKYPTKVPICLRVLRHQLRDLVRDEPGAEGEST